MPVPDCRAARCCHIRKIARCRQDIVVAVLVILVRELSCRDGGGNAVVVVEFQLPEQAEAVAQIVVDIIVAPQRSGIGAGDAGRIEREARASGIIIAVGGSGRIRRRRVSAEITAPTTRPNWSSLPKRVVSNASILPDGVRLL